MSRTSGEGNEDAPLGIEAGATPSRFGLAGWGGRLTLCAFMVSAGLVAGVTLHSWAPEFARSPYYSLPYSAATAPPVGDPRPLPDVVPVPLAQQPTPEPPPATAAPPAPPATGQQRAGVHGAG